MVVPQRCDLQRLFCVLVCRHGGEQYPSIYAYAEKTAMEARQTPADLPRIRPCLSARGCGSTSTPARALSCASMTVVRSYAAASSTSAGGRARQLTG